MIPRIFNDLLVIVVTAKEREEAQATAKALAAKLRPDKANFHALNILCLEPFFRKEGLLFLDTKQLSALTNKLIDSQLFLGQLVADPTARGLFTALALIGMGAGQGQVDLAPYFPVLRSFNRVMESALDGHPMPLSWQTVLGGGLADLAGQDVLLLAQPVLHFGKLQPGGAATAAVRGPAASLHFVQSGDVKVRITGNVALADEEFSSVAEGAAVGLAGLWCSITVWLFLACTHVAVDPADVNDAGTRAGDYAVVRVGGGRDAEPGFGRFGVLFVGIAVDFAIEFSVRYREGATVQSPRGSAGQTAIARATTPVAACATAAGFLAFVPTNFMGVAELGLIAGVGMFIAFVCTILFLPAAVTLFRPPRREGLGRPLGPRSPTGQCRGWHMPILLAFGAAAIVGMILSPGLAFDSNPLHTKNPNTEAMRTLGQADEFAGHQSLRDRRYGAECRGGVPPWSRRNCVKLPTRRERAQHRQFRARGSTARSSRSLLDASIFWSRRCWLRPLPPRPPPAQLRMAAKTALGFYRAGAPDVEA